MNCPHNLTELCSWCEAAIQMHNAVMDMDQDLFGEGSTDWFNGVQKAVLKYRGLVAKFDGVGVDGLGFIVPPEDGERP